MTCIHIIHILGGGVQPTFFFFFSSYFLFFSPPLLIYLQMLCVEGRVCAYMNQKIIQFLRRGVCSCGGNNSLFKCDIHPIVCIFL